MAKHRGAAEGSIFKRRSDGRWTGILSLGWASGKRRRKSFYADTQSEVIALLAEAREKIRLGLPLEAPTSALKPVATQTIADVLNAWLDIIKPEVKPRTFRGYRDFVRLHAIPKIGALALDEIAQTHIIDLIKAKVDGGMAPMSVRRLSIILRAVFNWASETGLMATNPAVAKKLGVPKARRRKARFLDKAEVRKLLTAAASHRLYPLISLALHTGCRKGELLGAKWTDFNFETGTFRVERTIQRVIGQGLMADTPKTEASNRTIYLAPEIIKLLVSHRRAQAAERLNVGAAWSDRGWLFTTLLGGAMDASQVHREWKRIVAAAGLPADLHFHDLRATAGSLLINNHVGLKEVSTMLGHSSIQITADIYTELDESNRRQVAHILGAILRK